MSLKSQGSVEILEISSSSAELVKEPDEIAAGFLIIFKSKAQNH